MYIRSINIKDLSHGPLHVKIIKVDSSSCGSNSNMPEKISKNYLKISRRHEKGGS